MLAILSLLFALACESSNDPVFEDPMDAIEDNDEQSADSTDTSATDSSLTFLALGDSYTIGESVPEDERWPVQLRKMLLDSMEITMKMPRIIARTGWTTDELQAAIKDADIEEDTFDLVSLLIGVNNQYRGYPIEQYKTEFPLLLDQAIKFAGGDTTRVFVVSIPDYGVTPFGQSRDPEQTAKEIDEYNRLAEEFATFEGVTYFNITPISREAAQDPSLIAPDGLHPSGKMYGRWVELIFPWAKEILDQ